MPTLECQEDPTQKTYKHPYARALLVSCILYGPKKFEFTTCTFNDKVTGLNIKVVLCYL